MVTSAAAVLGAATTGTVLAGEGCGCEHAFKENRKTPSSVVDFHRPRSFAITEGAPKGTMPHYILLLRDNPAQFADISPAEMEAIIGKYAAWR